MERLRVPGAELLIVFLVLASAGIAGCATATPTCDDAGNLLRAGQLGEAAERYALARDRGEGDCADTGLSNVRNQFVDAYVQVARGRVAEEGKSVEAAVNAYRAALGSDADNQAATDGLARLRQPAPQLRPVEPRPPQPVAPSLTPQAIVLLAVAVGLLGIVAVLLAWQVIRWGRFGREQTDLRSSVTRNTRAARAAAEAASEATGALERRLDEVSAMHATASTRTDTALSRVENAVTAGAVTLAGLRKHLSGLARDLDQLRGAVVDLSVVDRIDVLERHLDEAIEALTDVVGKGGAPSLDRYVPSEQAGDR